jgi:hypothetical protein
MQHIYIYILITLCACSISHLKSKLYNDTQITPLHTIDKKHAEKDTYDSDNSARMHTPSQ